MVTKSESFKMKKQLLCLFSLVAAAFFLGSCTSTRYIADSLKTYAPTDIALIEPYTDMSYIQKGNQAEYDDSLSWLAHETLLDCLEDNASTFPYGEILYLNDKDTWRNIALDVDYLLEQCRGCARSTIAKYPIPESLATFMADNGLPYAMLLWHEGMMRSPKNYANQVAVDAAVTLGFMALSVLNTVLLHSPSYTYYYGTPVKETSQFTVAVANADEGTLSFYNQVKAEQCPNDRMSDFELLHRLFKKYPKQQL